jgi:FtsH-binding integral membrane protein
MRHGRMSHRLLSPLVAKWTSGFHPHPKPKRSSIMSRFVSWLALAIAGAFLVVVSASFSLAAIVPLALVISIGTLVVSAGIAYYERNSVPSLVSALTIVVISAWTIVASLIFSQPTVQNLALGTALAISGLAVVGLTAHELSLEHAAQSTTGTSTEREGRLAAAA